MSKFPSVGFILIFLVFITSCSSKEETNYSPQEIVNHLLVNELLPIEIISNASEWPENVILGINFGLMELNEDGEDRIKDIFHEYMDGEKVDFIEEYSVKESIEFNKKNWIKSEVTYITRIKLNEIKLQEFKNNEIIQNKLNDYIPVYIKAQTEELTRYQFSFFSFGFWKSLRQIAWMHVKSIWGKIYNFDINFIKLNLINDLQDDWQKKFSIYFSPDPAKVELEKMMYNYKNLLSLKEKYFAKLSKQEIDLNSIVPVNFQNSSNNPVIDVKPIINQLNLTIIDNFGLLFLELLIGLFVATFVNHLLKVIATDNDEQKAYILSTLAVTGISPATAIISIGASIVNSMKINARMDDAKTAGSIINTIIGVILIIFSFWFISKKQNVIENEINDNFETNFLLYFNETSIQVLDELNFNTELFFTSL